jgi:hypothetical protein
MNVHASISAREVHDHAAFVLQQAVQLKDYQRQCRVELMWSILLYAAARIASISDACARLRGAPSDETLRTALLATLPGQRELERRLNRGLAADLPKALRQRSQRVVIDLNEVPYHGQPQRERREVRRGQAKAGTTHFHATATAYVVRHGQRFTLALTYVFQDDSLRDVLQRLLRQVSALGVKVRFLLLDREFFSAEVVRYLQASRRPFLMPVKRAGRRPKDPARAASVHRFFAWKKSGWDVHAWRDRKGRKATVNICVSLRNYAGKFRRRGRQRLVYAYWGLQPTHHRWVRELYRKRFGIETSYRQMHQARIRTSTRDPVRRLLFVGLALILRNAWVWFHLMRLGQRLPGGGVRLHLERLRFRTLLLKLQQFIESGLGTEDDDLAQPQAIT